MKKIRLFVLMLCLAVSLSCFSFAVYAATSPTLGISGTLSWVADKSVQITFDSGVQSVSVVAGDDTQSIASSGTSLTITAGTSVTLTVTCVSGSVVSSITNSNGENGTSSTYTFTVMSNCTITIATATSE